MTEVPFALSLAVGLALCLALGANNVAACLGTLLSSRALRYKHVVLIAALGLMAGALLEGGKMSQTVSGGIAPDAGTTVFVAAAASAALILFGLTWLRLPISLTQVFVGAIVGASVAVRATVNLQFLGLVAASWLLTPVAAAVLSALISLTTRAAAHRVRRVIFLNRAYAALTILGGAYSTYVLGANGVGLVAGAVGGSAQVRLLVAAAFGLAAVAGLAIFGHGTARSVAENIVGLNMPAAMAAQIAGATVVHGFTQVGMPVSISEGVIGGVFGAVLPRRIVVRNSRLVREIAIGWTVAPLLGAGLAFLVAMAV